MTTIAMIAGMLPIALGLGAGSELRSPMAIAVIGGLATSLKTGKNQNEQLIRR